jgi:type II secretory pathway component PulF
MGDNKPGERKMTAERERTLAGVAVGAVTLAWLAVVLLLFYVPRLTAYWVESAAPLSPAQRLLLALWDLVQHNSITIASTLFAATTGALWWRIHAGRRMRGSAHVL